MDAPVEMYDWSDYQCPFCRRFETHTFPTLVDEHSTVDADWAHCRVFETTLEQLHVELSDGDLELSVDTRDELADNFTALWTDIPTSR